MSDGEDGGFLVAQIVIERRIAGDGEYGVYATFSDAHGDTPKLVEVLGMLELTKDTAIRLSMMIEDGE